MDGPQRILPSAPAPRCCAQYFEPGGGGKAGKVGGSGEGDGGVAGFAKGGATGRLAEKYGSTLLSHHVEAQIGDKLAKLGQHLIKGAARNMADLFFANFEKVIAPAPA